MAQDSKLELPHLALIARLLELEAPESGAEAEVWEETRRRINARFKRVAETSVLQHKMWEALLSENLEFCDYNMDELAEKLMEHHLDKLRDQE